MITYRLRLRACVCFRYGRSEVLDTCRTEYMNPHRLSVRIHDAPSLAEPIKMIAYLIDSLTIRVQKLGTGMNLATINHDTKVDWLEVERLACLRHMLCRWCTDARVGPAQSTRDLSALS